MAALWPVALQQKLNVANFGYDFGSTVIRSDMDVGPAKQRRRSTKAVDTLPCSIDLEYTLFQTLYDFWDVTLNGGVNTFEFIHPFTQEVREFRMTAEPKISPLGGRMFRVLMQWELMP